MRIGFDDNRSLGNQESGARVALPVFREILLKSYADKLAGDVPQFPARMEENITLYLLPLAMAPAAVTVPVPSRAAAAKSGPRKQISPQESADFPLSAMNRGSLPSTVVQLQSERNYSCA
jgi:membrane carboxypeptidase/penicillin-binding protein